MRRLLAIALCTLVIVPGCMLFKQPSVNTTRFPVIPSVQRPQIDWQDVKNRRVANQMTEFEESLVDRAYALMKYSKELEATINSYNSFAAARNEEYEKNLKTLGIDVPARK